MNIGTVYFNLFVFCFPIYSMVGGDTTKVLWRPDFISYSIESEVDYVGQYLLLKQRLKKGESGWTISKMDLPDTWKVDSLHFVGHELWFHEIKEGWFYISKANIGDLGFEILDAGFKEEADLEKVWKAHAKKKN